MIKIKVLVVEPEKAPYIKEIDDTLSGFQAEVGGDIQAIYPFEDPVALVCNEEGKLSGLPLNRAMRDQKGNIWDIIAGTFLIVGIGEDKFASLTDEQIRIYQQKFKKPEYFANINGTIYVIPF